MEGVALDIFCDTAQEGWHELAPFLDPRSQKTAEAIGISWCVDQLYAMTGKDPVVMSKITVAFAAVRFDKLESRDSK